MMLVMDFFAGKAKVLEMIGFIYRSINEVVFEGANEFSHCDAINYKPKKNTLMCWPVHLRGIQISFKQLSLKLSIVREVRKGRREKKAKTPSSVLSDLECACV